MAGRITQQEYLNVYFLAEEGAWALVKKVLYEHKVEIGMSVLLVGKQGSGAVKVTGWVKKSVFSKLDPSIQKKVVAAINKGIVEPKGQQGITKLSTTEAAKTGLYYDPINLFNSKIMNDFQIKNSNM